LLFLEIARGGVYGVRCDLHDGMGKVASMVVGDPTVNLETAGQIQDPGKAKLRNAELLGQID
jgi:hypothetical protein